MEMLWTCCGHLHHSQLKIEKGDKCHQWGPGEHSRRTTGIGEHPLCAGLFKMVLRQKNTVYIIYIYIQYSVQSIVFASKKRVHVICAFGVHHTTVVEFRFDPNRFDPSPGLYACPQPYHTGS